ncbi:hypothetical protein WN943_016697 [Citrus x changshan-huyou]
MDALLLLLICCKLLLIFSEFSFASDILTSSQSLTDGSTIISKDGSFELGFFSPDSSHNRYVGIWYKNIPIKTVVWVANHLKPIKDSSGLLMINRTGNPILTSPSMGIVWSASLSKKVSSPLVLQLLDSRNLILRGEQDGDSENYFWQSFDYPSDTLLPGMKVGWDLKTGYPDLVMWKGSTKFYRTGPWNDVTFSASSLKPNLIFNVSFVFNEDELYYTFNLIDKAVFSRTVVNQTLSLRQQFVWSKATQSWELYSNFLRDQCDTYNLCGAYGICSISKSPICQCLKDSTSSWVSKSMNLNECREKCSDNSFCMAYTNSYIRGEGSGCAMWFGDLIDIRYFQDGGQDLYIRMCASELGAKGEPTTKIVVTVISSAALLAVVLIAGYLIRKRRRNIANQERCKILDWSKRFHIICGTSRGVMYLHQASRLMIIHRDLKASNVLLDQDINPKISDFGLGRAFGGDETEGNTNRVVGT